MALEVETGTGSATAESYLSVADYRAYWTARGVDTASSTDAQVEVALRAATQYLDAVYTGRWKGERATTAQRLDFPRLGVLLDGVLQNASPLPRNLREATAELARRHLTDTTGLLPDTGTKRDVVQESTTVGEITTSATYAGTKPTTKKFAIVEMLLGRLLWPTQRAVRA